MTAIASVMETKLITVKMTETVTTAATRMRRNNVGALWSWTESGSPAWCPNATSSVAR